MAAGLLILALYGCQSDNRETAADNQPQSNTKQPTPNKMLETLIGEWQLESGGDNQQGNRYERLRLTSEARYIAYSGGQKVDSGAYRMNEQLRNLYLESEAGGEPREYEVELQGDMLKLRPRQNQGQAAQADASSTYRRIEEGTRQPNPTAEGEIDP